VTALLRRPAATGVDGVAHRITPESAGWRLIAPGDVGQETRGRGTYLEETYYYRLARPDGFAVQRVYTDDRSLDETMAVGDRDVVLVPRGYHPVGAPHGFDLYYLNVMAGPVREWRFTVAPECGFLGW